jgi:hypothetical protein
VAKTKSITITTQPTFIADAAWAISDGFTNAFVKANKTFTRTTDKKKLNEIHDTAFLVSFDRCRRAPIYSRFYINYYYYYYLFR